MPIIIPALRAKALTLATTPSLSLGAALTTVLLLGT